MFIAPIGGLFRSNRAPVAATITPPPEAICVYRYDPEKLVGLAIYVDTLRRSLNLSDRCTRVTLKDGK
jgi:hypothetical protein